MNKPTKLITKSELFRDNAKEVLEDAISKNPQCAVVFCILENGDVFLNKSASVAIDQFIGALEMAKIQTYLHWKS